MKKALALIAVLAAAHGLQAQFYRNSSGVRLGYTSALTYKHFLNEEQAVEFMASGRGDGFQLTTTYQFNQPLEVTFNDNFYLYYGVGAHIGYERKGERRLADPLSTEYDIKRKAFFAMGVDTILGIEYRWLSVPVTVGLDVKPYLDFVGMRYTNLRFWDTALTIKYVF